MFHEPESTTCYPTSESVVAIDQEVAAFEQALAELAENPNSADLPQLHLILDDACEQPEVMFGLVHFLESFSLQEQLQAFIQVLPQLGKQASEWVAILYTRMTNDAEGQVAWEEMMRSLDSQQREAVDRLLSLALGKQSSTSETRVA